MTRAQRLALTGKDFLDSSENLGSQIGNKIDPISGFFTCRRCNYAGSPIVISKKKYSKIKFSPGTIRHPANRANKDTFRAIIYLSVGFPVAAFLAVIFQVMLGIPIIMTLFLCGAIFCWHYKMKKLLAVFAIAMILSPFLPPILNYVIGCFITLAVALNVMRMKEFASST